MISGTTKRILAEGENNYVSEIFTFAHQSTGGITEYGLSEARFKSYARDYCVHIEVPHKHDMISEMYVQQHDYVNIESISIYANHTTIIEIPFVFIELYKLLNNAFATKYDKGYFPMLFNELFDLQLHLVALAYTRISIHIRYKPSIYEFELQYDGNFDSVLPPEIWCHIMYFLDTETWGTMRQVCKEMYGLSQPHVFDRWNKCDKEKQIPIFKARGIFFNYKNRSATLQNPFNAPFREPYHRHHTINHNMTYEQFEVVLHHHVRFMIIWIQSKDGLRYPKRKIERMQLCLDSHKIFDHDGYDLNVLIPSESRVLKECGITTENERNVYIYPFIDNPSNTGLTISGVTEITIQYNRHIQKDDTLHFFTLNDNILHYRSGLVGKTYV